MLDFIVSGGVSPLMVTLAVLVIGTPLSLILMLTTMPKNNKGNTGFQSRRDMSKEKRWSLIQAVERVYDTLNLKTIQNVTSETMFLAMSCTCKILQQVGVRKVVEIKPDTQRESAAALPFAWSDGKNDLLVDVAYCSYTERYLDSASDKVLYEKSVPKALLTLTAIKGVNLDAASPKFCTQCGAPISLSGDFYHCEHCSAHYQSDAYEWTVTGLQPQNEAKGGRQSNVIAAVVMLTLALALISQFVAAWPLHLAVYALDALLVAGMALFLSFMKKNIHGSQTCQKADPLFSRQAFQRRAEYLYRLYRLAQDTDVTLLRPFMEAESYAKLEADHVADGFYFLDNDFYQLLTPSFKMEDGKQWMECYLSVFEVTINEKRKVKKKKKKIRMILVRGAACKTEPRNGAELYVCEHCGASVNLAQDGVCKYCGNAIDLLSHDWCIHQMEEA